MNQPKEHVCPRGDEFRKFNSVKGSYKYNNCGAVIDRDKNASIHIYIDTKKNHLSIKIPYIGTLVENLRF